MLPLRYARDPSASLGMNFSSEIPPAAHRLMCAQKILKVARSGTARMTPTMPTSNPEGHDRSHDHRIKRQGAPHYMGVMKLPSRTRSPGNRRGKNERVAEAIEAEHRAQGQQMMR